MPASLCANEAIAGQAENPRFNDPRNLMDSSQRQEIVATAQSIPDRTLPVLWIDVISKTEVDVLTGVIRGPLDGGGRIFKLRRENGKWIYIKEEMYRSWVSENNLEPDGRGRRIAQSNSIAVSAMRSSTSVSPKII
jgi:hypothetical protein